MRVIAENISKRFNRDWIFNQLNLDVTENTFVAITGTNGSGKSTLLQILASLTVPTTGTVSYFYNDQKLSSEDAALHTSFVGPYQEVIEEMTLTEFLQFHFSLRKGDYTTPENFMKYIGIEKSKNKEIRYFSSGMKQRLKLGIAFCTYSPLLFLDEPTSYLDSHGIDWYEKEIEKLINKKTILLASNIPREYQRANRIMQM
ncbi:MAG: ABC transporter ATP-binding protein [Cytophagaceae bacterium]